MPLRSLAEKEADILALDTESEEIIEQILKME